MLESTHLVRIEKHRVGDIVALTFSTALDADDATSRPLVFVVHGLMSRKERHIELCLSLAEAGFRACTLDARHHGERATPETMAQLAGGPGPEFLFLFADAIVGTALDIAALGEALGEARYGVIGHSMGGYVALRSIVSDPNVAAIVSISGNPDWTDVPSGVTLPPIVLETARAESPISHPDAFWPRPVLLLHGDRDETVSIRGARRLRELLEPRYASAPERLAMIEFPGHAHEFIPPMATHAIEWMRRFLQPE